MPESSLPPTPTKSGSGPLLIVGVLMLAAIGGLLFWKGSQEPEKPEASAPPAAPSAPTEPVLNVAPPPPPPPDEEPAPEASASAGVNSGEPKKRVSPCESVCNGTAPAALRTALQARARQARACYQSALRQGSTAEGKLVVAVKVSSQGSTCGVSVAQNTLGAGNVVNCALAKFRPGGYPKPEGGCVNTQVPINFVSKQ